MSPAACSNLLRLTPSLEKVVLVNYLLEPLQPTYHRLIHNALREGFPGFWPNDSEGMVIYFQVRVVSGLYGEDAGGGVPMYLLPFEMEVVVGLK
eukprot:g31419.t1